MWKRTVSVNLMTQNEMTIHNVNVGCTKANNSQQTGVTNNFNCTDKPGCTVLEENTNSVGAAFANAGGGVWAAQFDVSGTLYHPILLIISYLDPRHRHFVGPGVNFGLHSSTDCILPINFSIWFWNVSGMSWVIESHSDSFPQRANLPSNLQNPGSTIDTSAWGTPSGAWPSTTCDTTTYFTPQKVCLCGYVFIFHTHGSSQLVLDITLCGDWAGVPSVYNKTCSGGTTGVCVSSTMFSANGGLK
jgi:hypothetical protein